MSNIIVLNMDVREWEGDGTLFHAMLTDPPYEIDFMGKGWDGSGVAFDPAVWERLRSALHPGAFAFSFAGAQMQSWVGIANAILQAGFVPHPTMHMLSWVQSQGWPKGTNVSKAIDREAGAERVVVGNGKGRTGGSTKPNAGSTFSDDNYNWPGDFDITAPATPLAKTWDGYHYGAQALRPCSEPCLMFQAHYSGRPLDSITTTGAGALNIEAGRIGHNEEAKTATRRPGRGQTFNGETCGFHSDEEGAASANPSGRFPSNVLIVHLPECRRVGTRKVKGAATREHEGENHGGAPMQKRESVRDDTWKSLADADGLEEVDEWECAPGCPAALLGEQSGRTKEVDRKIHASASIGYGGSQVDFTTRAYAGEGDASRFYHNTGWEYEVAEQMAGAVPWKYAAKASTTEREAGLLGVFPCVRCGSKTSLTHIERNDETGKEYEVTCRRNQHVTVKPIGLTRHLASLLLPPKEYAPRRLLIPYAGVGSEAIGAMLAGWDEIVCIEQDPAYCAILEARAAWWRLNPTGAVNRSEARKTEARAVAMTDLLEW